MKLRQIVSTHIRVISLILVSLIPLILFLNRFLIPDTSFDTINYHLFLGQRGFRNFLLPYGKGEFFPSGLFTFSPVFDVVSYVSYLLLGYRLGPIVHLLAYFVLIYYLYKIIRLFRPTFLEKVSISEFLLLLNAAMVTELLLEVATYLIETITTMFAIAALFYLFRGCKEKEQSKRDILIGSFLLGIALFGKMTNFILLVPIVVLLLWYWYQKLRSERSRIKPSIAAAGSFILLLGPFLLYSLFSFITTKNPFFPFYNGLFKSPYYSNLSFTNSFFGGANTIQKLLWPVYSFFTPKRLGEMHDRFNDFKLQLYTISLGVIWLLALWKKWFDRLFMLSLFVFLMSAELWAIVFGYSRYGTVVEALGGCLLAVVLLTPQRLSYRKYILPILIGVLTIINILSFRFNLHFDYSWRPALITNTTLHKSQIKYLFAKKIPLDQRTVQSTDIIINCVHPTSAYYTLTDLKNKPMVLTDTISGIGFLQSPAYQHNVAQALAKRYPNKQTLSFAAITVSNGPAVTTKDCTLNLQRFGYHITSQQTINGFLGYPMQTFTVLSGTVKRL